MPEPREPEVNTIAAIISYHTLPCSISRAVMRPNIIYATSWDGSARHARAVGGLDLCEAIATFARAKTRCGRRIVELQ